MGNTAGLFVEPPQPHEYVQLADGKWYHHENVKGVTMERASEEIKENPKYVQAQKDGKPRMEYLVGSVLRGDAAVHAHGADKYGERNWRVDAIKASTYEAAILRHFMAYFYDREDVDPDSGLNHLYHIRACCAVMIDSEIHDTLIDDRDRGHS